MAFSVLVRIVLVGALTKYRTSRLVPTLTSKYLGIRKLLESYQEILLRNLGCHFE